MKNHRCVQALSKNPSHFSKKPAVGAGSAALRGQRCGAPGESGPRAATHTAALEAGADVGKRWILVGDIMGILGNFGI